MTHLELHRCRFVDFPPSQITTLAFSHPSTPACALPPPKTLRLAIGRSNGSIEIWNPLAGWHHETTLSGGADRSIEGLAWTCDPDSGALRLFSIGYSTTVTEWNLATGKPATHVDVNGGVVWSIAAQPRPNARPEEEGYISLEDESEQKLVVGTDDGTIKVLSTAGGLGELAFVRNLTRAGTAKARVLTLAWKDRNTVVAGMADSAIRVWDVRSARSTARMSLNRDRGRDVLVWALKVMRSGDIVSGDSRGEICFWDGTNYTLRQRVSVHEADVLALELGGVNGECVVSGSVDMRTVLMKAAKGRRWGEVSRKRFHRHDVRAMAAYECGSFSVLVSGGVDMTPIIIPFRNFTAENHRLLPLVPQHPIVTSVPESRLLMSYWEREVKIWRVEELSEAPVDGVFGDEERGRKLLSRIILNNEENITSAAISPPLPNNAGYILAVATIAEVKLFHLRHPRRAGSQALSVSKIPIPSTLALKSTSSDGDSSAEDSDSDSEEEDEVNLASDGARHVLFSPDGKRLACIRPDSQILVASLSISPPAGTKSRASITLSAPVWHLKRDSLLPPLQHTNQSENRILPTTPRKRQLQLQQRPEDGNYGEYLHTITKVAFSNSSRYLAVADLAGNVSTFVRTEEQDGWNAVENQPPKMPSAVSILSFRPARSSNSPLSLPAPPPKTTAITSPTSSRASSPGESPEGPAADDDDDEFSETLLVIPAETHHILTFSVRTGRLSAWSRRNPMATHLPVMWAGVKDRAVGAFWERADRLWVFGASWVWMFDLSRDWPVVSATSSAPSSSSAIGKRKRGAQDRTGPEEAEKESESESDEEEDADADAEDLHGKPEHDKGQKPFWGCWRWRNVLAFLPVGRMREGVKGGKGAEGLAAMEVAVVERPVWDVDMPPRFYGR